MADDRRDDRPQYTVYRSRPRLLRGREEDRIRELRDRDRDRDRDDADGRPAAGRPEYQVHGRRPGLRLPSIRRGARAAGGAPVRTRPRLSPGRIAKWLALAVGAWLLVSLVVFLISAQIESSRVPDAAKAALSGGGYPLTSANTILVVGTDARPRGSKEPGATIIGSGGPERSDTLMLLRVGGGANAQLSILRDTLVDIPGHGQDKINAAYAYGGPALTIRTVEGYLGIPINHLVQVDFANFPALVDALGGIDYTGGCVHAELNGGRSNGGVTLRLKRGTHHLSGKRALALARVRHNLCAPNEDDRDRAARQQKILSAMKARVTSPSTFLRLPWVSWAAPKAVQSDMAGPSLLGLVGAELLGGGAHREVLRPAGFTTLANGGSAVTVDEAQKRAAVQRFLKG